jgi:hypothetical protein
VALIEDYALQLVALTLCPTDVDNVVSMKFLARVASSVRVRGTPSPAFVSRGTPRRRLDFDPPA